MAKRMRTGAGTIVGWLAVAVMLASAATACGSDGGPGTPPASSAGASGTGSGGEAAGPPSVSGDSAGSGNGGSPTVTPGNLVCNDDNDCPSREKPVCDQVQGCVACQYD